MAKPKPGQRKGWGNSNAHRLSAPRKAPAVSTPVSPAPTPTSKPWNPFEIVSNTLSGKSRRPTQRPATTAARTAKAPLAKSKMLGKKGAKPKSR